MVVIPLLIMASEEPFTSGIKSAPDCKIKNCTCEIKQICMVTFHTLKSSVLLSISLLLHFNIDAFMVSNALAVLQYIVLEASNSVA